MKVVSMSAHTAGEASGEVDFLLCDENDEPFGLLWISTEGVFWSSDITLKYGMRSWESFSVIMTRRVDDS